MTETGTTGALKQWLRNVDGWCAKVFYPGTGSPDNAKAELEKLSEAPRDSDLALRLAAELLSESTRLVRRNLLVAATVTVLIGLGANPAVLVSFPDRRWLPLAASAVVTMFLLAEFIIYVQSDVTRHRISIEDRAELVRLLDGARVRAEMIEGKVGTHICKRVKERLSAVVIPDEPKLRTAFDFAAPAVWGALAIGYAVGAFLDHLFNWP